jgi:hypothetical protein
MEATHFPEMSGDFQRTTQCYIPDDRTRHIHRCENLKSYKHFSVSTATVQRGDKKIGDQCNKTMQCGFDGAVCAGDKKPTCQCQPELPATNHIDKCGKRMYSAASSLAPELTKTPSSSVIQYII